MWRETRPKVSAGSTMTLAVNDDRWHLQIVNVRQMASDWFVELIAMGPRTHTIFLRSDAPPSEHDTSRRVLARIGDWLRLNDSRLCAILDLRGSF